MIMETVTIVAKEVAKKAVDATVEIAKKEVAELPEKIGELTEVEALPDKIDILPEKMEQNLEQLLADYFEDLKNKSECPDTISEKPFHISDLEKLPPEEVAIRREEFSEAKSNLKKQWEEENGRPWPKYTEDVYSSNGKLIRKAGSDYDAHHIQPLCMGGKNVASNITPLHAEVHYDKQGIHSPDSPYSKIDKALGGNGSD